MDVLTSGYKNSFVLMRINLLCCFDHIALLSSY